MSRVPSYGIEPERKIDLFSRSFRNFPEVGPQPSGSLHLLVARHRRRSSRPLAAGPVARRAELPAAAAAEAPEPGRGLRDLGDVQDDWKSGRDSKEPKMLQTCKNKGTHHGPVLCLSSTSGPPMFQKHHNTKIISTRNEFGD